jgi:protein ATS1
MSAIFALGSNGSGQLGINHKEDVSVPKQVTFQPDTAAEGFVKVAAGGNHTLLLGESGRVFWSGDASSGACGITSKAKATAFRELQLSRDGSIQNQKFGRVAATWDASFLVQEDDAGRLTKLYSLGTGLKGELGLGEMLVKSPSATLVKDFAPVDVHIVDIAACMGHVVIVLSDGSAYGWGNGRKGQLGSPPEIVHSPRKINGVDFKVTRVVCGREFTCLFGEPTRGHITVLGSDNWNIRASAPELVPDWRDVGASWGNIYTLTGPGALLSWGRNDHGQLPPLGLPPIVQIAIGSEHAVALSEEGDVLAWGWGEHGNCGPQVENGDVKGRWNVIASSKFIPPGAKITGIGAGCATSWVNINMG